MFFPLLTALSRSGRALELTDMITGDKTTGALSHISEALEQPHRLDPIDAMELACLAGDLLLAQDDGAQAEEQYRLSLSLGAQALRGQPRVVSCRNTGMISLYRRRHGVAAASFRRVTEDPQATLAQQVEAWAGLACVQHALARQGAARLALDEALGLLAKADAARHDSELRERLTLFITLLRAELEVLYAVRTHVNLADHAYWLSDTQALAQRHTGLQLLELLCHAQDLTHDQPLLVQRLRFLGTLVHAGMGLPQALEPVHEQLQWLRRAQLDGTERDSRMEATLMAIATRDADLARQLLEPLAGRTTDTAQRWSIEMAYCRAKLSELTGQSDECLRHYQRYTYEALVCLRQEAARTQASAAAPAARGCEAPDEVELALPARYRRAYRYLLTHLERADLSVREVADHIGVTERALQAAFRTHLGMTPAEVMRRQRVERIRADLLRTEGCGPNVIETAARWGIRNRSTLVASYRKQFRETPADTLARREARAHA